MYNVCIESPKGTWKKITEIAESELDELMASPIFASYPEIFVFKDDSYVVYRKKNGRWLTAASGGKEKDEAEEQICASFKSLSESKMLRKVLDRVRLRNFQGRLMEAYSLNESPSVGIFWVDPETAKVYGDEVAVKDAEIFGRGTDDVFAISPHTHYDSWDRIKIQNKKWKNEKDYELAAPRGRVIVKFTPEGGKFIVYASPKLNDPKYEKAIRFKFSLPWTTEFRYDDEHYEDPEY